MLGKLKKLCVWLLKKFVNMENKTDKIQEVKNWDTITKWILGIAAFLLIFSFIAPALFVSKAFTPKLDQ